MKGNLNFKDFKMFSLMTQTADRICLNIANYRGVDVSPFAVLPQGKIVKLVKADLS